MKKIPVKKLTKIATSYLRAHSADFLTGATCAGVVATAIFTHKGTLRAAEYLHNTGNTDMTDEQIKAVKLQSMKYYIPAVVAGGVTIASAVGANCINHKKIAGMAAACALAENALTEHRDKIEELLGEDKLAEIDEAVNLDAGKKMLAENKPVALTKYGNTLYFDKLSGMRFRSNQDWLEHQANIYNARIPEEEYLSYAEYLESLDARNEDGSMCLIGDLAYNVGYNYRIRGHNILKLEFTSDINEITGEPYVIISPYYAPVENYTEIGL